MEITKNKLITLILLIKQLINLLLIISIKLHKILKLYKKNNFNFFFKNTNRWVKFCIILLKRFLIYKMNKYL